MISTEKLGKKVYLGGTLDSLSLNSQRTFYSHVFV